MKSNPITRLFHHHHHSKDQQQTSTSNTATTTQTKLTNKMVHTVGLFGANGLVGSGLVKLLSRAAQDGKIKLVVIHREGNPPKDVTTTSDKIELRVASLDDSPEKLEAAIKGINVVM